MLVYHFFYWRTKSTLTRFHDNHFITLHYVVFFLTFICCWTPSMLLSPFSPSSKCPFVVETHSTKNGWVYAIRVATVLWRGRRNISRAKAVTLTALIETLLASNHWRQLHELLCELGRQDLICSVSGQSQKHCWAPTKYKKSDRPVSLKIFLELSGRGM